MPTMTPTKTAKSALSKRSFDSFAIFKDPEYITGIQGLGTLQPLHNTQQGYWAVKEESWKTCKWTATESDFEPGSVLWNHTHRFQQSGGIEKMHAFIQPRLQIIHSSNILVVDDSILGRDGKSKNIIVGDLSMPEVEAAFKADQDKAKKDAKYKRQYSTRTKYLVNVLTKDNTPAHEVPLVFTVKGLASVDLSGYIRDFRTEMEKCLSVALGMEAGVKFDNRVKSITVFVPTLGIKTLGLNNNSICVVESYEKPAYSTKEIAQESLLRLTVPDEARAETWKQMEDEFLGDYINKHSQQEAAKLGGNYGIAEGVPALMPQGATAALPASEKIIGERDKDTGEIQF
tara:strand:+ start:3113 stop:4144 length:1032 start_codon:yes stop_codon:yes gene_type:complete